MAPRFHVMEPLLWDFSTDLWPVIEHHAPGHVVHFLKASTCAMSDDAATRVEALADTGVAHRRDGALIHAGHRTSSSHCSLKSCGRIPRARRPCLCHSSRVLWPYGVSDGPR
jgi:hypothetical protein